MIKVEVNRGEVDIKKLEGNGLILMSELCCLVNAVCTALCADVPHSKEMTSEIILTVADALVTMEKKK